MNLGAGKSKRKVPGFPSCRYEAPNNSGKMIIKALEKKKVGAFDFTYKTDKLVYKILAFISVRSKINSCAFW